jgi:hypothetical protein
MHNGQAFRSGESFIIDIFDFYHSLRDRLGNELGMVVFEPQLKSIIDDIVMYTFHGDQSKGERVVEAYLIKLFCPELMAIKLSRRLFELFFDVLRVKDTSQLLGRYTSVINYDAYTVYISLAVDTKLHTRALEPLDAELDDAWIPERQRRTRANDTCH